MKKILSVALCLAALTLQSQEESKGEKSQSTCVVEKNFKEPTRGKRLKKHISVDLDVDVEDITIMRVSETMGNGIFIVCIKGTKYKYRKVGTVYYKDGNDPLKLN